MVKLTLYGRALSDHRVFLRIEAVIARVCHDETELQRTNYTHKKHRVRIDLPGEWSREKSENMADKLCAEIKALQLAPDLDVDVACTVVYFRKVKMP